MKKNNMVKKLVSLMCVMVMGIGLLSGCKKENNVATNSDAEAVKGDKVLTVGGHDIYKDEVMVYCLLTLLSGKLTYNDVVMDEASVRDAVLQDIRENKVLYDVCLDTNMEFNEDDISTRDKLISSFKGYIPQEVFDTYGISDEIIEKVFTETSYVDKLENDTRNSIGQMLTDKYAEEYKDANFQNLYYVMFPTVEEDEDGAPKLDENGEYISLDEEAKMAARENAESARDAINGGQDAMTVAEEYEVDAYSTEQTGMVGAYSEEMNEVLGTLEDGQSTDIYESDMGYYFIVVLENNDQSLIESYAYSLALNEVDGEYENQRNLWLSEVATITDADFEGDTWINFDLLGMAADLYQRQLMY